MNTSDERNKLAGLLVDSAAVSASPLPVAPLDSGLQERLADALDSVMMNHSCNDCDECIEGRAALNAYLADSEVKL